MPSALARIGGGRRADNLLKGSDLPLKTEKINIVCTGVREAPAGFNSPFIMEIEEMFNKTDWAVNQTNTGALVTLIGDDYEKWHGHVIELTKYITTNPKLKSQSWGLIVTGAKKVGENAAPARSKRSK